MALGESHKVIWSNIFNAPVVNYSWRDQSGLDEIP
jgi:hypothetical protein